MSIILREHEIVADIRQLNQVWDSNELFALLPEKLDVSTSWVEDALGQLPEPYRRGSFALLTSGSTGKPKVVFGQRERAERLVAVLHELQRLEAVAETVVALPISYCYAFVNQWLWAKTKKRRFILTHGFKSPEELLDALRHATGAMYCAVGAQMTLFRHHFTGHRFPGVSRLHFAGGQFPQKDMGFICEMFPNASVFNNYGCAEAMPRLTLRPWEDSQEGANIGRPLPGIELKADDEDRLFFRSPYGAIAVFEGQELKLIGPEDWTATGDLGERLEDGAWRLKGRSSEVFKRFGEKIALPRLLASVDKAWGRQAAFYREKDKNGEDGHVLVLAPSPSEPELQAVLMMFRKNHPRTHWPLRIETVERLPLLANGKTDIQALAGSEGKKLLWEQRI